MTDGDARPAGFTDTFGNTVASGDIEVTFETEVLYGAAAVLLDGRIVLYGTTVRPEDATFPRHGLVYDPDAGSTQLIVPAAGAPSGDLAPAVFHVEPVGEREVLVVDVSNTAPPWSGILDVDAGTWSELATPDERGERFVALPGGDVLWTRGPGQSARFDVAARSWRDVSDPAIEGSGVDAMAVALDDGGVLVVGLAGNRHDDPPAAWRYDATTDAWEARAAPATRREHARGALMADGRVLRVGGELVETDALTASTEIYDPLTDVWGVGPDLGSPRKEVMLVRAGEQLLALGGFSRTDCPTAESCLTTTVEGLVDGAFQRRAPMPAGFLPVLVVTDRDPMLVVGSADIFRYRP